jgi:hypothetical protein
MHGQRKISAFETILKEIDEDISEIEQRQALGQQSQISSSQMIQKQFYNEIIARQMGVLTVNVESSLRPKGEGKGLSYPIKKGIQFNKSLTDRFPKFELNPYTITIPKSNGVAFEVFMADILEKAEKDSSIEIEASFGYFDDSSSTVKFFPGIKSQTEFSNLRTFLELVQISSIETEDVIEITSYQNENIRCRYNILQPNIKIFESKIRSNLPKDIFEIKEIGIRITKSLENRVNGPKIWRPTLRRLRKRVSFIVKDLKISL